MLKICSTRLTFRCQSFPVPQDSVCQCIPSRRKTILVCPGLHHISCKISEVFSRSEIASRDRNVVHTLSKPPSGCGCSCDSFLRNIQFTISGGTAKLLIS